MAQSVLSRIKKDGFVRTFEDGLIEAYIGIIREKDPDLAVLLLRRRAILGKIRRAVALSSAPEALRRTAKKRRMDAYVALWEGLTPERQYDLADQEAKINTMARCAEVIAVTDIVQAHNALGASTAGSIDFVLRRFKQEGVTSAQVQQFVDENALAWFSLTAHPTNPATVEYSLAEIELAAVLADPASDSEKLKAIMRKIFALPIVGDRKTPLDELEETLGTLDALYTALPALASLINQALERNGYGDVKMRGPLLRPCIWPLGDADGNPSITGEVAARGIPVLRSRVKTRYLEDLSGIEEKIQGQDKPLRKLQSIRTAIDGIDRPGVRLPDLDGLLEQTEDLLPLLMNDARVRMEHFILRLRSFRFCFAAIDVRHNAEDVMDAAAALMKKCGDTHDFKNLTDLEKQSALAACLKDAKELDGPLQPEDGETAAWLFNHLLVFGDNPDACEKLIIAETTHASQALACLFLLKLAGHEICNQRSRVMITTLSESSADLASLGTIQESLLDDPVYRQHTVALGRLLTMIAKSDTTRQDGRGKAEYAQYEGAVASYGVVGRMRNKYPELTNVTTSVMNGGGMALQRGGGRVTEVAALHGRAAMEARATRMGPSTLTIQGHHQRILCMPGKAVVGSLEELIAQNLYSAAGLAGEMPPPKRDAATNRQYARRDAWLFARVAGEAFDRLVKDNPAFDELLVRAPWLSMKAGNVSSRPGKRGEKLVGPGVTPAEAKGKNPKALQGRAISGERLTAHACLPLYTVLGQVEAMEAVLSESQVRFNPGKYGNPLHHLYLAHKGHRDGARVNILAASLADFDIAWPLLAGRERPSRVEVRQMAGSFRESGEAGINTPEASLAFLEEYFLNMEKLSYEMVTGKKAGQKFRHGDGLKKLWPDLAEQVECRNLYAEFARVIEAKRTREFDANADRPLDLTGFRITQAIYTAADVVDAPTGIVATRTRLDPRRHSLFGKTLFTRPQSYSERPVLGRLSIPRCLQELMGTEAETS